MLSKVKVLLSSYDVVKVVTVDEIVFFENASVKGVEEVVL